MADYFRPGDVAKRLSVSPSGLRRIAAIYSAMYGDMPRDEGDNRLWPAEAVERLEAARALVTAGQARSIKEALEALERGVEAPQEAIARGADVPATFSAAMSEALQPLLERLESQEREIRALRDELRAMRGENQDLHDYLAELPAGEDKTAIAELQALRHENAVIRDQLATMRDILEHLAGEEHRESRRRPWWQVWRKG